MRSIRAHVERPGDTLGQVGDRIGVPGIPQHPILAVVDKVAVVAEDGRLPDAHTRRPRANVRDLGLAAIEYVEAVDAGRRRRLRQSAPVEHRQGRTQNRKLQQHFHCNSLDESGAGTRRQAFRYGQNVLLVPNTLASNSEAASATFGCSRKSGVVTSESRWSAFAFVGLTVIAGPPLDTTEKFSGRR